jgi:DNA repair and recombination protein RAD54B
MRRVVISGTPIQVCLGLVLSAPSGRLITRNRTISQSCTQSLILSTPVHLILIKSSSGTFAAEFLPGKLLTTGYILSHFETPILRSREPNCLPRNVELGQTRNEQVIMTLWLSCYVLRRRHETQLGQICKSFVLRRTADVLSGYLLPKSLPYFLEAASIPVAADPGELGEFVVFCAPTPLQLRLYKEILSSPSVQDVFDGKGSQHLVLITTLKKLCNTPGLLLKHLQKVYVNFTSSTIVE